MPTIYTRYNRPVKQYEENTGEKLVERHGFVSARDQFRAIIAAGKRLDVSRGYDTDVEPDIDKLQYDPTRRKNYDLADYTQDVAALRAKMIADKEARIAAEKAAAEAAMAASGDGNAAQGAAE